MKFYDYYTVSNQLIAYTYCMYINKYYIKYLHACMYIDIYVAYNIYRTYM